MFHLFIVKAAVASPPLPRGPKEATRILQACVVAWPGVVWHGGLLAEGSKPKPKQPPPAAKMNHINQKLQKCTTLTHSAYTFVIMSEHSNQIIFLGPYIVPSPKHHRATQTAR